jgi:hypothetical protein
LRAGGASLDSLAAKFDLGPDAISRHWHNHVTPDAKAGYLAGPAQMDALAARAAEEGDSVLDYLRIVRTSLMSAMAACSEAGDARGVSIAASTLITALEKIGRLTGEIAAIAQGSTTVNIALINSPQFLQMQAEILRALATYPDARGAVVAALRRLDAEANAAPVLTIAPQPVVEHGS